MFNDSEEKKEEVKIESNFSKDANDIMTNACLDVVRQILYNLYTTVDKVPFGIRFMIRSLVESSMTKLNIKDETVFEKSAYLIADMLSGCWFNTAFRCYECFGMPITLKEEATFTALFMKSSRLIFEHTLLLKPFPVRNTNVNGFNIPEIN